MAALMVTMSYEEDGIGYGANFNVTIFPSITKVSDAELLRERAPEILRSGLTSNQLRLVGKTLTLVIEDREFILSINANNRNINGEIALGGGFFLKFDIKGNGSNIKEFRVYERQTN